MAISRGWMIENSGTEFIERMCMGMLEEVGHGEHLLNNLVMF